MTPLDPAAPRPPLELLAEQWEAWGADLDPVLDDVNDLAAAAALRTCAAQLREALRAQAEADKGLDVGWAGRVRLDWDDFNAFSKVLFFALHSPGNRNKLQNFTELSDEQIAQLVRLCEDYEQRAALALAQANGDGGEG